MCTFAKVVCGVYDANSVSAFSRIAAIMPIVTIAGMTLNYVALGFGAGFLYTRTAR